MDKTGPTRYTKEGICSTMAILDIKDLSAGYENGFVIRRISLAVEKGEFVCLLGRNGSGKSTLLKATLNLLRNVRGQVLLDSEDVPSLSRRVIATKIAYVPQLFEPVFEFTVGEIVLMGRYARQRRFEALPERDRTVIEEALRLTGTEILKDKRLSDLSGGELQRTFIARALAQDTPVLLLDEPSLHLDISYQVDIYRILKRLQMEKKKTILAAEHNVNLAVPHADRLVFLKNGTIEAQGTPAETITEEHIRQIFDAEVEVRSNPRSGLPEISLVTAGEDE